MSYSSLQHPEHDHKLFPVKEKRIFKCRGCQELGFGNHYKCTHPNSNCEFHLHLACAEAHRKPPIKLPLYGDGYEFKFCTKPVNKDRYCVACGKRIRRYNYRSSRKNIDLHPSCTTDFPLEHTVNGVPVRLEKSLHGKKCLVCQRSKYGGRDLDTWAYVSKSPTKQYFAGCILDSQIRKYRKALSRDGSASGSQLSRGSSPNGQNGSTSSSRVNRNQAPGLVDRLSGYAEPATKSINQILTLLTGWPSSSS